jgi:isopenicillin N synthase-like dioxygenase
MALRTVDLSGFLHGNEEQRRQVAAELVDSLKALGFVRLINHEVPEKTIEGLLEQVRPVPIESKQLTGLFLSYF